MICMCDFEEGEEIKTTPCRHLFHKDCITRWLGEWGQTCPSCKKNIVEEDEVEEVQTVAEPTGKTARTDEVDFLKFKF